MKIAVDIETTGLNKHLDCIVAVGIHCIDTDTVEIFQCWNGQIPNQCKQILEGADTWITHNGTAFDLHFLRRQGVKWPKHHYDTLIGELLFAQEGRADFSVSLANTIKRRLGFDGKLSIEHKWNLARPLTNEEIEYLKGDIVHLHSIMLKQGAEASKQGMLEAYEKEQALTLITAEIMYNGLAFNRVAMSNHNERLAAERDENLLICQQMFGEEFNPNSPVQTKAVLEKLGCKVTSTGVHDLMYLAVGKKGIPEYIMPILKVRQASHKLAMYKSEKLKEWVHGGRVYGEFRQLGTTTTRYSSRNPNLQQIPTSMRDIIGGEEGKVVIAPDYSQIEVRIKAHLSQDQAMLEALNSQDFHTEMAKAMFPGREITPELRKTGKGGTFTLNFDGSYRAIQRAAIREGELISNEVAQGMVRGYYQKFKAQLAFNEIFRNFQKQHRPKKLNLPWGHSRIYEHPKATQMINNYVQGTAAVGFKEAALLAHKQGLTKYLGGLLHDEFIATSVPIEEAEDYSQALHDVMVEGMSKVMPGTLVAVEVKSGEVWTK